MCCSGLAAQDQSTDGLKYLWEGSIFRRREEDEKTGRQLRCSLIHTHETSVHTGNERTESGFPASREEVQSLEESVHSGHALKSPS